MSAARKRVRRHARSNPTGAIEVMPSGFAFVRTAEGEFFVPSSKLGGAFDGDIVEVAPVRLSDEAKSATPASGRRRPSARVVRVVERAHEFVIGRYEVADPFGVVVPSDPRIPYDVFTMRADSPDVPDGSIVRVRMTAYPARNAAATGVVEAVLGAADEPAMDIEAVIARRQLETRFDDEALAQAGRAQVDAEGALAAGYRDLRGRFVFTVDPVDARDFDDALSVERAGDGLVRVGVHIADVSHYVPWGTPVDACARRRATSVYLADRVLPMLPEALSNGVCSLVPGQVRRAMTCEVVLDSRAQVRDVALFPALIASSARLSYDQAQCFIQAQDAGLAWRDAADEARNQQTSAGALPLADAVCAQLFDAIGVLDGLAQARSAARRNAGGIDFDSPEAKVVLDGCGEPVDVRVRRRTRATALIEEMMILANECVAEALLAAKMPALFRVHPRPDDGALAELAPVLAELGYDRPGGDAPAIDFAAFCAGDPFAVQAVLDRARGRSEEEMVDQLVLRAMQRAVYAPTCAPHYGLASGAYLHFTSPIRRYPDLVVHRMVRAMLIRRDASFGAQADALPWLAEHASAMERIADAAARESQELMLVRLMQGDVGKRMAGTVSGVATFGLFVRLPNTAEGVVPVRALGDEYFTFDADRRTLRGQDSGRVFRLGQRLEVVVAAAPDHARKLELRLA